MKVIEEFKLLCKLNYCISCGYYRVFVESAKLFLLCILLAEGEVWAQ